MYLNSVVHDDDDNDGAKAAAVFKVDAYAEIFTE
jgi:hypothetical protein